MTEYHKLSFYGRTTKREQSFLVRDDHYDYSWVWWMVLAVATLSVFTWLVLDLFFPTLAQAQQTGPMNNKEVCEDVRAGKYLPPAGHVSDMVRLCWKYGINL